MIEKEEHEVYSILLKGPGLTIERSLSADLARRVVNLILGGATTANPVEERAPDIAANIRAEAGANRSDRVSLREFLDESQAARNPDKIVTIGEYLCRFEAAETFSRDGIKGRFRSAGEPAPANFPRDFSWTIKNGWIAEDSRSPGDYYVTQKGRNAIESRFASEIKKSTARSRKRARKTTTGERHTTGDDME